MSRRVTNKGESGFGIANERGKVAVEWKHHRCDRLKRRRDLSVEVSVLETRERVQTNEVNSKRRRASPT